METMLNILNMSIALFWNLKHYVLTTNRKTINMRILYLIIFLLIYSGAISKKRIHNIIYISRKGEQKKKKF